MILAWLLLLTGLTISAVAIYYSVVGLAAIFSAAVIPIVVMGSALEVAKLVCASWLKANWEQAPRLMKLYMTAAVIVLMLVTSMGIFGFLSKAHSDQSLVSGDVQSRIALYDEKIKIERENVANAQQVIKQMDAAVNGVITTGDQEVKLRDGSTKVNSAAERSLQIRRSQAKDRAALTKQIEQAQAKIVELQEQRAPIAAEVRKVEAEVGPLKYIAAFVYGATDETLLEKAVTWVIIIIIIVFDPLAIIMLLAAQMTFGWHRNRKSISEFVQQPQELVVDKPTYEPDDGALTQDQLDQINDMLAESAVRIEPTLPKQTHTEEVPSTPSTALGGDITAPEETIEGTSIDQWNKMIEEAEKAVKDEKQELIQDEARKYHPGSDLGQDRIKPDLTEVIEPETADSKKKTYMIKDQEGQIQIKHRE